MDRPETSGRCVVSRSVDSRLLRRWSGRPAGRRAGWHDRGHDDRWADRGSLRRVGAFWALRHVLELELGCDGRGAQRAGRSMPPVEAEEAGDRAADAVVQKEQRG